MWKIFGRQEALHSSTADELVGIAQELGVSAQELRRTAQKEFKRLRKFILKSGGSEKVCYEYWKFLENHRWFQDWGIVLENEAPYSKLVVMLSALDLLESWKKTTDKDEKTIRDLMELLSMRVYIAASLSFELEEIEELHRRAGGVPGEITLEPHKSTEIANNMRDVIGEKRALAESRWSYFRDNGFDVFEAIKNA